MFVLRIGVNSTMLLARFDEQHRGGSLDLRLRDYCPVPVNGTVFDVAGAATFTFTVAVLLPLELGRNVTLTVQFAPGAREAGHRLFWLNWFAFAPPSPMELIVSGAVPVLVTVTTCAGLIVRMGTFPNANDVGRTWFTGATPVPVRATTCGLVKSESVIVSVPLSTPAVVGTNLTLIRQLRPGPRLPPQLLVSEKFALHVMLLMVIVVVPTFESVTV
jgi:hypothetical protein